MLRTNKEDIVEFYLQCQPCYPKSTGNWGVDISGTPFILPSTGGITLNIEVGDRAFGWSADHIEPGVSCAMDISKPNDYPNLSLQIYSCTGNGAKIISGEAKGSKGTVIGTHGGSEHLIINFDKETKEKMSYDDKILVTAHGQGLKLLDYPEIYLYNLSPLLLNNMKINESNNGCIEVPVTTIVNAECMGSGIGSPHVARGDYDIISSDVDTIKKYNIDKIRLGDIVAIMDHDNRFGRTLRKGAVSIGIVVHGNSIKAGHGPGVTTLMTSAKSLLKPVIDPRANIADILKIGKQL